MPYLWKFPGRKFDVTYFAAGDAVREFWMEHGDDVTIVSWGEE